MLEVLKKSLLLLIIVLVLSLLPLPANAADPVTISLVFTSDLHGHLEPFKPRGDEFDWGGMARISSLINKIKEQQPNLLILDGGDVFFNSDITNLYEGESTVAVFNAIGYDAVVLGNHDFDMEPRVIANLSSQAKFAILSANVFQADGNYLEGVKPYLLKEVSGVRIGIIGLTDQRTPVTTHPLNVKDLRFIDQIEIGQRLVKELRGKVDILVALTHLHLDDRLFLQEVSDIDVMIAGGTHERMPVAEKINGALMVRGGEYGKVLNRFDLTVQNGKVIKSSFRDYTIDGLIAEDQSIASIVKTYRIGLEEKMKEEAGRTTVELMGERAVVRAKESNLGNLIADAIRYYTGAEIALQNGGGIRATIAAGPVTLNDIYNVLPFDNRVVKQELTGSQLLETLENGCKNYPALDGRFLQVSGLEYIFDPQKPAGKRIVAVKVAGRPLVKEQRYIVASNDFMALGGDEYNVLTKAKTIEIYPVLLREVLRDYFSRKGIVSAAVEGRIKILNGN